MNYVSSNNSMKTIQVVSVLLGFPMSPQIFLFDASIYRYNSFSHCNFVQSLV
jgi:hypothetical protein